MKRRGLPTKAHGGFQVKVFGGTHLPYTHLVPQLSITMANNAVTEDFFVVDLDDMEVILGIQWMESLDEYTQSFKRMDFTFVAKGKKVVLRGMANEGPKEVSAQWMEAIFRHDYIAWAAHCFVSVEPIEGQQMQPQDFDLQAILSTHDKVIVDIPTGIPPHRRFEHTIELEAGAKPVITTPYRHPKKFKDEIEQMI